MSRPGVLLGSLRIVVTTARPPAIGSTAAIQAPIVASGARRRSRSS
jgi:hypothetical protein